MDIYTRTGDKGTTSLANGTRVCKNHIRVETYGSIDELNAHVALVKSLIKNKILKNELSEIESNLFIIQTHLAIDPEEKCSFNIPDIQKINTIVLEKNIDRMDKKMPPIISFVPLGGSVIVAQCHIARCVCRRAERTLITLSNESTVQAEILSYINRLSDYLFVLARYTGKTINSN